MRASISFHSSSVEGVAMGFWATNWGKGFRRQNELRGAILCSSSDSATQHFVFSAERKNLLPKYIWQRDLRRIVCWKQLILWKKQSFLVRRSVYSLSCWSLARVSRRRPQPRRAKPRLRPQHRHLLLARGQRQQRRTWAAAATDCQSRSRLSLSQARPCVPSPHCRKQHRIRPATCPWR